MWMISVKTHNPKKTVCITCKQKGMHSYWKIRAACTPSGRNYIQFERIDTYSLILTFDIPASSYPSLFNSAILRFTVSIDFKSRVNFLIHAIGILYTISVLLYTITSKRSIHKEWTNYIDTILRNLSPTQSNDDILLPISILHLNK